jgi:hypothetical protein
VLGVETAAALRTEGAALTLPAAVSIAYAAARGTPGDP